MNPETRNCQNCKKDFVIEPDDFSFYEKIKVPPPTFCPECRMQRRFAWRNERFLYHKPDYKTGEMLFSALPPEAHIKTMSQEEWMSDSWDPIGHGREYDFSRSFFDQFKDLMSDVPWSARWAINIIRSDYNINTNDAKDCYLVMSSSYIQNSAYCVWLSNVEDSLDLYNAVKSALCYDSTLLKECSQVFFSTKCESSQNLFFCRDCIGCTDCFGCVNLRNKSYCIYNEEYSKEEYHEKLKSLYTGSYTNVQEEGQKARAFWLEHPVRYVSGRQNVDTTGDYIYNSKNVHNGFSIQQGQDMRYCQNILEGPVKDSYDYSNWGENAELMYEALFCGLDVSNCQFCIWCWTNNKNLKYCMNCRNSSDCFGCVGLNNKQYCIFNVQYSKEAYEILLEKIVSQMKEIPYTDAKGNIYRYGEFFPIEMSPTPYNESIAQEFFPLEKDIAKKSGYFWHQGASRDYKITIQATDLPDSISEIDDSIFDAVIGCVHGGISMEGCMVAYRITHQEMDFYRRFNLPLPRECFNCRHARRLQDRNPARLYKRSCQCVNEEHLHHNEGACENTFETSYAPERPEIVYCEQCYQQEIG